MTRSTMQRAAVAVAIAAMLMLAAAYVVMWTAPRADMPLALDTDGVDGPAVVRDRQGRTVLTNFRTVEKGVLYRGSAFPTSFGAGEGGTAYADETVFEHLRSLNVRHVLALVDTADKYYAEDGYLRYWSDKTGFRIGTTWVQIDPTGEFGRDDRGGLRAAGILISLMREGAANGGAMYVHDLDGVSHAGVAAAGYELWRNRGWNSFDTTWVLVERRFLSGQPKIEESRRALQTIRDDLRFVIEL